MRKAQMPCCCCETGLHTHWLLYFQQERFPPKSVRASGLREYQSG